MCWKQFHFNNPLVNKKPKPPLRQGVDLLTDGYIHNLLTDGGFMYAVRQLLRLKESALAYFALPCNSYTFMSQGTHDRNVNEPFGCLWFAFVQCGNILGARTVLLIMLACCRSVQFFLGWTLKTPVSDSSPICNMWWRSKNSCPTEPDGGSLNPASMAHPNGSKYQAAPHKWTFIWIYIHNIYIYIYVYWYLDPKRAVRLYSWNSESLGLPLRNCMGKPRCMGRYGAWSLKPQLGLGNWFLGKGWSDSQIV